MIDRLVFVAGAGFPKRPPLPSLCSRWLNAEMGAATGLLARSGDRALVVPELPAELAALVQDSLRRPDSLPESRPLLDEGAEFRWF